MPTPLSPWRNCLPAPPDPMLCEMDDALSGWFNEGGDGMMYAPHANLIESDQHCEVSVDLPGLKPEEVTVELQGDTNRRKMRG